MKTFKLLQLEVQGQELPLEDGVIINQENSRQSWLLETFITEDLTAFLTPLLEQQTVIDARAVISFPDNEPAPFQLVVRAIKPIDGRFSVLFSGKLVARRGQYAEQLLTSLLSKDLTEQELLTQFKTGMRNRPRL